MKGEIVQVPNVLIVVMVLFSRSTSVDLVIKKIMNHCFTMAITLFYASLLHSKLQVTTL